MVLSEIISTGMNNPECAFFTGAFVGGLIYAKLLVLFLVFVALFRAIEKLAITPLIEWLHKKIWRKK